ncbi:MAG: aminoglycoside phosphotransferase family protein [Bacteroidota bacterium]
MQHLLSHIFEQHLSESIESVSPIEGLGGVNHTFSVRGKTGEYVIRLNDAEEKAIEYKKEAICLTETGKLGILGPQVLAQGIHGKQVFLILEKLPGKNGTLATKEEQAYIWHQLGTYARIFQTIPQIDDPEVQKDAFHQDWKARLAYNLKELNGEDELLRRQTLSPKEHQQLQQLLHLLEGKDFPSGLVHGDVGPRNVLLDGEVVYLLDWGTAVINVVPHTELGLIRTYQRTSPLEFQHFLEGMQIDVVAYQQLEREILLFNLLNHLDVYRWAQGNAREVLSRYEERVRNALEECQGLR